MDAEKPDFKVYEDKRGKVIDLSLLGISSLEVKILVTNEGMLRGGDSHSAAQNYLVLEGELEVTMKEGESEDKIVKRANEFITIEPNIPHLFKSLTRTVVLKYGPPSKSTYYEPYRKLVQEQLVN